VTEVNLERNRIGKKGVKFLAQALRINNRLRVLRLGHNGIGGEDGINELKEALSENDTLEELYLDQNNLENLGAGDLANFLVIN
jgi:Ran GTPase-activating protein (RanGAP) involved in mRNA processing and transport